MRGALPRSRDIRRAQIMNPALILAGFLFFGFCAGVISHARGQGAPQPVPVPEEHRLFLLGGTYPRGARVTLWTQAGHEFTGRLQGVGDTVVIERGKDCVRIRQSWIYAVSSGGGR